MNIRKARHIVNAVLNELEGRGGFDIINVIMADKEVYEDMYDTLVTRTLEAYTEEGDPKEDRYFPEKG